MRAEMDRGRLARHRGSPTTARGSRSRIGTGVFGLFYSTKGSQGTGLGLAVTHKIIAEHGGNIRISESPDGGALVRILLPQNKDKE